MFTEQSIQQVRDLPIIDVVGKYIKIKQRGNNATACCPFHHEKTASFNISNTKGIYKCFGCGKSGDGIRFVMEERNLEFLDAVEAIAGGNGIALEIVPQDNSEAYKQQQTLKQQQVEVINYAINHYHNNLLALPTDHPVIQHLYQRGWTNHTILKWRLGWCTPEWRQITERLINDGLYNAAETLGVIGKSKDDQHYDAYRSRIIFPIQNQQGKFVGMGGRWTPIEEKDNGNFKAPKYFNSKSDENSIYQKGSVLYGLHAATRAIKQRGFAWLVEGYADTISMHAYGDANTVGSCGTSLTIQQALLLKKYTNSVTILRDGDDAGQKAAARDISILLEAGIRANVAELPEMKDPDDFIKSLRAA